MAIVQGRDTIALEAITVVACGDGRSGVDHVIVVAVDVDVALYSQVLFF